jgi:regulator of sigma D
MHDTGVVFQVNSSFDIADAWSHETRQLILTYGSFVQLKRTRHTGFQNPADEYLHSNCHMLHKLSKKQW